MNNEDKLIKLAIQKIKKDSKYKQQCLGTIIGPTGPIGLSETIEVGDVVTGNPGTQVKITDEKIGLTHKLNFTIPRGDMGASVSILGSYSSIDELKLEHSTGNIGDGYLVEDDLYVWTENDNDWKNVGKIRGPQGPKGEQGPTGPSGYSLSRAAYLVKFNNSSSTDGIEVAPLARIPIDRSELDISNIVTLDNTDNTLKFNETGYYKISFTISAYPAVHTLDFDPTKDFVSIGFKLVGTDNIYIGGSEWVFNGKAIELYAQGIISVVNTNNKYELVNLGKSSIYLNTPDLNNIASSSYFSNPLVTIVIDFLGRQGA